MFLGINFVEILQGSVIDPSLVSAFWVFLVFVFGEFVAVLPTAVVLTTQAVFIDGEITLRLMTELTLYVAVPVGLGTTVGSLFQYGVAYAGGKPAIDRFHRYLRFSWKDIEKIESYFKDKWYDEIIFLLLRSAPFLPSLPINIASGIVRMRLVPYLILTAVGTTVRAVLMLGVILLGVRGLL